MLGAAETCIAKGELAPGTTAALAAQPGRTFRRFENSRNVEVPRSSCNCLQRFERTPDLIRGIEPFDGLRAGSLNVLNGCFAGAATTTIHEHGFILYPFAFILLYFALARNPGIS